MLKLYMGSANWIINLGSIAKTGTVDRSGKT